MRMATWMALVEDSCLTAHRSTVRGSVTAMVLKNHSAELEEPDLAREADGGRGGECAGLVGDDR